MNRFIFICLLLRVGSVFAQSQSASQNSKTPATSETIQKPDFTISNASRIAFSSDGRLLAVGSAGGIRIYDVQSETGKSPGLIQTISEPSGLLAMTFCDTNTLVSLALDQSVKTWDVASGRMSHGNFLSFGKLIVPAFAPGNRPLLAGGFRQVSLWNYRNGQLLKTFAVNDSEVSTLSFTPDGKLLVIGTFKGVLRVLDVAAWKVTRSVDLDSPIRAGAATTNRVVVGYSDGTLAMVDFGARSSIEEIEAHKQAVSALAFSPVGDRFASGSVDGTVKVWDTKTLKPVCTLEGHAAQVTCIAFSPDGRTVVSSGSDGRMNGWRLPAK